MELEIFNLKFSIARRNEGRITADLAGVCEQKSLRRSYTRSDAQGATPAKATGGKLSSGRIVSKSVCTQPHCSRRALSRCGRVHNGRVPRVRRTHSLCVKRRALRGRKKPRNTRWVLTDFARLPVASPPRDRLLQNLTPVFLREQRRRVSPLLVGIASRGVGATERSTRVDRVLLFREERRSRLLRCLEVGGGLFHRTKPVRADRVLHRIVVEYRR